MKDTPRPTLSGILRNIPRRRLQYLMWTAVGIVALAGVMFAASALSSPRESVPALPVVTVSPSEQSRKDYTEALSALASDEATAARELLEKAIAEDPDNEAAVRKLEELRNTPLPTKPKPKDTPPPPPGGAPGPFDSAVSDVGKLLPAQVAGFVVGQRVVEGPDAELPLDPDTRELSARVSRVQLSVHDRGSRQAAEAYVTQHRDTLYPNAKGSPDIIGTAGKSGIDSGRLAAVLFSRGRFAFEVVVTSTGSDPSRVLDVAVDVAKTFPTTF